jgi:GTP-binding protein HflX
MRERQVEEVNKVLKEIGADHVPQLMVWNKTDLRGLPPAILYDEYGAVEGVRVSALSGAGLELLREAIAERALATTHSQTTEKVDHHGTE